MTFQSGIMVFLTSIPCCPEVHWSMQTKHTENLWTAIPAVNSSQTFNKICKWLRFKKWLENQYYHTKSNDLGIIPFQKTMFYLMKSKYAIFSNFNVTKIERYTFFWDTRYMAVYTSLMLPISQEPCKIIEWDVAISWQLRGLCGCYGVCIPLFLKKGLLWLIWAKWRCMLHNVLTLSVSTKFSRLSTIALLFQGYGTRRGQIRTRSILIQPSSSCCHAVRSCEVTQIILLAI